MPLTCHCGRPMKKTTTKLQFKKSTVRLLQDTELQYVNGGGSIGCTEQQGACSHPPQHPPGSGNSGGGNPNPTH